MRALISGTALAAAMGFAALSVAGPALAATATTAASAHEVHLVIDGRQVERSGAILRNGVVYVQLIGIVRSFSGVIVYAGPAATVTIAGRTAIFTNGSASANLDGRVVPIGGKAFDIDGNRFVPLPFVVNRLAQAKLSMGPGGKIAYITTANKISPLAIPSPSPVASSSPIPEPVSS